MIKKATARTVLSFVFVVGYILITGGFFFLLFAGDKVGLPSGKLGESIIGMLGLVVGTWNSGLMLILTFNFGTSKSSADKNQVIEKALERAT